MKDDGDDVIDVATCVYNSDSDADDHGDDETVHLSDSGEKQYDSGVSEQDYFGSMSEPNDGNLSRHDVSGHMSESDD